MAKEEQSTPEKWSSIPMANIVDPDRIFLPREECLTGNESEDQEKAKDYPFPGADISKEANIQPSRIKGSVWNRDRSKDGEREPEDRTEKDYKKPVESGDLSFLKEGAVPFQKRWEDELDAENSAESHDDISHEYRSEIDGLSTFADLDKPEPSFEFGSDTTIPDFLKEARKERTERLQEARKDINQFFVENPLVDPKARDTYTKYVVWAKKKGLIPAHPLTFSKKAQTSSSSTGVVEESPIESEEPKEYSTLAKEVIEDIGSGSEDYVEETFRNVEDIAAKIAHRDSLAPHHGFIYGSGGIGKTYTVVRTVEDICDSSPDLEKWKILKGSTTAAALYTLLWKYRDGWVIIFDDNDGVLSDRNAINYLKAAMDPDQPRIVSKSTMKSLGEKYDDNISLKKYLKEASGLFEAHIVELEDEEEEEYDDEDSYLPDVEEDIVAADDEETEKERLLLKRQKELRGERSNYWIDHIDPEIDPATAGGEGDFSKKVPPEFQFASRIIFISNLPNLPQPLADRVEPGEVKLNKKQILDRVEMIMDNLVDKEPKLLALPDKGRKIKEEVLSYLRKVVEAEAEGIRDSSGEPFTISAPFTFRLFAKCVAYRVLYPGIWKKRVLKALREKSAGVTK